MTHNALYTIHRLSTVLAMMLATLSLPAQELTITEASQAMEPMTVPMQRLDFNNQICALVKVVLPVSGVGFEGNTVGDTPFKIIPTEQTLREIMAKVEAESIKAYVDTK